MKKIIDFTIAITFVLVLLSTIGCMNPSLSLPVQEQATSEGSVSLRLLVPNYGSHSSPATAAVSTKVISPDSRVLEVFIDGMSVWGGNIDYGEETTSNGFFYTSWTNTIKYLAGTYDVRVDLLDDWNGTVLTSGTANGVVITTGGTTEIFIGLTPPAAMFSDLDVDGPAAANSVNYESMVFYRFPAAAGIGYSVTVTPTAGAPDFYLFDESGRRPGTELGFDYAYTSTGEFDGSNNPISAATTLNTYQVETTGTYYIGVYGWRRSADFNIEVATYAGAIARPVPGTPPDPTPVEVFVDNAFAALDVQDFEGALSEFSLAYAEDRTYGPAFAGYNALYLMSLAVDPDIVSMARGNFGELDYPTTMGELFSGQWMQEYLEPGETHVSSMPRIEGQTDMNSDGVIDSYERLVALAGYVMTHNTDFNALADLVLGKLGDRLDYHVAQIMSMPPDVMMTFTWDMMFDDWESEVAEYDPDRGTDYNWPTDDHGNPLEITIGRADLMLLASMIKMQEFFIHMGKVYNLNLLDGAGASILEEYWATFSPDGGSAPVSYTSSITPFMTEFLEPRDTWEIDLDAAQNAFVTALEYLQDALYEIKADPVERTDFFLSSTSTAPKIASDWGMFTDGMEFAVKLIDETLLSVTDPEGDYVLYVPIAAIFTGDFDYYTFGNWPTSFVPGESVGANLGTLFLNPFSFLIELAANGEPVWYEFSSLPTDLTVVADIANPAIPGTVYARVYDLTLNGLIPPETLDLVPRDDEETRMRLELDWNDMNNNEDWDPGEDIWSAEVYPEIEGVVDFYNNNLDFMYPLGGTPTGDPMAYYTLGSLTVADIPDAVLSDFDSSGDYTDFRAALTARGPYFRDRPDMLVFLYNTELYVGTPADVAWHSFAVPGTGALDQDGDLITAAGSFWWALLNQAQEQDEE
jgi:hypothetical protein